MRHLEIKLRIIWLLISDKSTWSGKQQTLRMRDGTTRISLAEEQFKEQRDV